MILLLKCFKVNQEVDVLFVVLLYRYYLQTALVVLKAWSVGLGRLEACERGGANLGPGVGSCGLGRAKKLD